MALSEHPGVVEVARSVALSSLGLAMLLVGGALWPMLYGLVESLGLLRGDVAADAALVSGLTALVLAAYVATVARWWYGRQTSVFVAASLFPLYATYFYLIRDAFWI